MGFEEEEDGSQETVAVGIVVKHKREKGQRPTKENTKNEEKQG